MSISFDWNAWIPPGNGESGVAAQNYAPNFRFDPPLSASNPQAFFFDCNVTWQSGNHFIATVTRPAPGTDPHYHQTGQVEVFENGAVREMGWGRPWKEDTPGANTLQGVMLAGALISAGSAAGFLGAGATSGAGAAAGAELTSTQVAGESSMFDFGDTFGFSDGESAVAFSDSEVVDFGFVPEAPDITPALDEPLPPDVTYSDGVDLGDTPEVVTNDYGTTFDPAFGDEEVKTAVQGVKLATTTAGTVAKAMPRASAGASGAKQAATAGSVLAVIGDAIAGAGSLARSVAGAGTPEQRTTAVPRTYTGQLGLNGPGVFGGISVNTLLLIAGGLIVVAFVLKK